MTVGDVGHILEQWAPRWIAWERDNVGLQVGERSQRVRRIHVCLDVTQEVIREAIRKKADLIVSHHPLLFRPPSALTDADRVGDLVLTTARRRIAVYAAHTNLDFTRGGVSFALAEALGLTSVGFLSPLKGLLAKVVVFVPDTHRDRLLEAMASAGAGTIGEYSHCSFQTTGRGTFRGSAAANPFLGTAGKMESVNETRMEMILPRARTREVVAAMKSVHPYEEAAFDVYPLDNESTEYGAGAIGVIPPVSLETFLRRTKKALKAESLRWTAGKGGRIRRVAVCGGSGSDLLPAALAAGADAFVTSDLRYHASHEAEGRMALVDAGHWETEHPILPVLARRLETEFRRRGVRIGVSVTRIRTSPIHSF